LNVKCKDLRRGIYVEYEPSQPKPLILLTTTKGDEESSHCFMFLPILVLTDFVIFISLVAENAVSLKFYFIVPELLT
jgi:hypothetical protein